MGVHCDAAASLFGEPRASEGVGRTITACVSRGDDWAVSGSPAGRQETPRNKKPTTARILIARLPKGLCSIGHCSTKQPPLLQRFQRLVTVFVSGIHPSWVCITRITATICCWLRELKRLS